MTRSSALLVSALSTMLVLAGLSVGIGVGTSWAEGGLPSSPLLSGSSVVEITIWVVALIGPIVVIFGRRKGSWLATLVVAIAVGAVSYVRYESARWSFVEGVGFVLGTWFFRFVLGICSSAGEASSERGGPGVA